MRDDIDLCAAFGRCRQRKPALDHIHFFLLDCLPAGAVQKDKITVLAMMHLGDHGSRCFGFRALQDEMITAGEYACGKCHCRIILQGIARTIEKVCMKHIVLFQRSLQQPSRRRFLQHPRDPVSAFRSGTVFRFTLFLSFQRFLFLCGKLRLSRHPESP